ncbi:MAG TPA: hypothetical protein VL651_02490, partial [Bacteroidia bacterium]|nr:hypothetical protein [Bacteroidia bacterium]
MLMLRVAAQPSFFKTFGGTSFDWGYGVVQTADGGYAAAGYTHSYGAGNNDLYLVKTDSIGTVMWAKCYGSTWIDEGRDLIATDDGGYAICGEAWFSTNNYDYYLVRTDSAGTILWSRLYGGNDEDKPYAMAETNDGGFIISGTSRSFPSENTVVTFIVRTDAAGDTVWSKHYNEGITTSYAQDIQSLANGNFIVAGYNWASSTGGDDPMLMEIDSAGNILWARKYDHPGAGEGVLYRVMQDDDGDLVAVGQCYDAAGQTWECYAMKTDSAGHLLWEKVYGEPGGDESFFDLKQAGHDRYAVTGNVDRFSTYMDVTLLLLDSTGDTIWTRAYGGSSIENGMAMNRTDDNGFVITGNTLSFGSGSGDLFLLKTDSAGYSGCNDIIDPGYVLYDLPSPVEINLPMISYPGGFELTPSSYTFGGCISSYVCPLSEEQQVIKSVDVSVFP